MRFKAFFIVLTILVLGIGLNTFGETEDEIVERYMSRLERKRTQKLSWASFYFGVNRINRHNDYNTFISNESNNFSNGSFSWLGQAKSFGFDLGVVFNKKYSWWIGGEFWTKMSETLDGSQLYIPAGAIISNPKSEIKVSGITTGLQYYFKNYPQITGKLDGIAFRVNGTIGLYQVTWDLWPEYSYNNLNLSTSAPTNGVTTSYKDSAPGFMLGVGVDYPTNFYNSVIAFNMGYLYLNFDNVAWYNTLDEEVIATMTGEAKDRVDLNFSGFKGRIEIKKFFSW